MAQMEGPEWVRAPGPSSEAGPVGRDRELNGIRADKTHREMVRDIWRNSRVAEDWSSDGWMHSQAWRWIPKAETMVEGAGAN